MNVKARFQEIRDRMEAAARRAGRDPGSVRLVAVTKMRSVEEIDTVEKFWSIDLLDSTHTVHYGLAGKNGRKQTREFDSIDDAKSSLDKLVQQKLKKGYVELHPHKATLSEGSKDNWEGLYQSLCRDKGIEILRPKTSEVDRVLDDWESELEMKLPKSYRRPLGVELLLSFETVGVARIQFRQCQCHQFFAHLDGALSLGGAENQSSRRRHANAESRQPRGVVGGRSHPGEQVRGTAVRHPRRYRLRL